MHVLLSVPTLASCFVSWPVHANLMNRNIGSIVDVTILSMDRKEWHQVPNFFLSDTDTLHSRLLCLSSRHTTIASNRIKSSKCYVGCPSRHKYEMLDKPPLGRSLQSKSVPVWSDVWYAASHQDHLMVPRDARLNWYCDRWWECNVHRKQGSGRSRILLLGATSYCAPIPYTVMLLNSRNANKSTSLH